MKRIIFFVSFLLTGMLMACVDKNEAVDEDSKPDWLSGSIYQELKEPNQAKLSGTFTYYLRLVDDLGLTETLSRTGSKTVFPANDEAFNKFFQSNDWGVTTYDQLTVSQKKLLLYNSMLDNALLISMMSNMSNANGTDNLVLTGKAMKHQTNISVIDTVSHITSGTAMPQNNKYWDLYRSKGINVVRDATRPMMIHFTREQMLNNNITTTGEGSDFNVLTNSLYTDGTAYIFNDRVIKSDITCQNGYIHQVENVIVPPGNMAEVLEKSSNTKYFSRILDYFSAPYYSKTITDDYNSWALANGKSEIDSIFEVRYLSSQTAHATTSDPKGNLVTSSNLLAYDPGWNQYSPQQSSGGVDYAICDIGAMFVPTDDAIKNFFLPSTSSDNGGGAYLIDIYGSKENTEANLAENLDSLQSKRPDILTSFVKNLMKSSFVNTVPSKFTTLTNDAQEDMGMNMNVLNKTVSGAYDIAIANNGVIYKLNTMLAPDEYQSVMAPSSTYEDMQVMNYLVKDPSEVLNVGFKYYLLAMKSKYAFFVPDDNAFDQYFVDVTSLGLAQPKALHLYYKAKKFYCDSYTYDPETNTVGTIIGQTAVSKVKSLLIDILNNHTVILNDGMTMNDNHYYKTKNGGEIYISANKAGGVVKSGQQIYNDRAASEIEKVYSEKNGSTYRINHVIEAPITSVSTMLQNPSGKSTEDGRFSEFYSFCAGFSASEVLAWAGISNVVNAFGTTDQDAYIIFTTDRGSGTNKVSNSCIDENVKMFNTYNYTLYAPDNAAMEKAYTEYGLPRWSEIQAIFEKYSAYEDQESDEVVQQKALAYKMINAMKDFARYHFQSTSIYADNVVDGGRYNSLSTNTLGIANEMTVSGGSGKIQVTDVAGVQHTVDASNSSMKSNLMTREYWFDSPRTSASSIYTSSFCVVHELADPLHVYSTLRYDGAWKTSAARAKAVATYKRLKQQNKL
jgi:uncharacterized surface protein with fasciclin (FAS1) repeats